MKSLIKNKIEFNNGIDYDSNNILNISYGVDDNFLFGSAISMVSIMINNPHLKVRFHLFTDSEDKAFLNKLKELSDEFNTDIIIYILDPQELKKLPTSEYWSYATYFRFFIFDHLSESTDTVLYLDADVVCKGKLDLIMNLKFSQQYAAVVPDVDIMQELSVERLKVNDFKGKYFNAGVIYINLKMWKKSNFTAKAFELLSDESPYGKLKYLDQDALNILFERNNIYLDRDYNCIYSLKNEISNKDKDYYKNYINEETKLIHFTGVTKPWHYWAINYPASESFKNAYLQSPWKSTKLKLATKRK